MASAQTRRDAAKGFMTGPEVRRLLAIRETKLWGLCVEGVISRVVRGAATRYTRASVEAYAAQRLITGR